MRILAERTADASGIQERVAITVLDGKVAAVETWNDATGSERDDVDARDCLLVPGFIDIHVHGGAGRAVMEGTRDALDAVASHLSRHGVTGFLSTTITAAWEQQTAALHAAAACMRSRVHRAGFKLP